MLPNPLHPAIVHFPIVLVVLLPFFAVGALWAIHRGARPLRAWGLVVALAATLSLSAFVSVRTGAAQEDKVEPVLSEQVFESHEEAGERFLVLTGVFLLIAGAGLLGGVVGRSARLVAVVGALGLLGAGFQVGRSGGELVYTHGAASVYASATDVTGAAANPAGGQAGRARTADDD